jgi:3-hydroxyisobutyrate dehydrogenase-like beta-hydroxyacid dehydrogenase
MNPTVAVIAPGNMGAAVGARLVERGLKVVTSLTGRSPASAERATAAGMMPVTDAEVVQADFVLSIVPPGEALGLARRLAPVLDAANRKPLYVDCNAVSPQTVSSIAIIVTDTGSPFADGGIIGGPPRPGQDGPRLYVSGPEAKRVEILGQDGLDVRAIDGSIGDASALKMCYGGLTKGLTALGSALALAATRSGAAAALHAELSASQPNLLGYLTRSVPDMFQKAYRFADEMEEIAAFIGRPAERKMYEGMAKLYQQLAREGAEAQHEVAALAEFFAPALSSRHN